VFVLVCGLSACGSTDEESSALCVGDDCLDLSAGDRADGGDAASQDGAAIDAVDREDILEEADVLGEFCDPCSAKTPSGVGGA